MSSRQNIEPRQPLLRSNPRRSSDDLENAGCCKSTTTIISVLFVCGILSLACALVFFMIFDKSKVEDPSFTTFSPGSSTLTPETTSSEHITRKREVIVTTDPTTISTLPATTESPIDPRTCDKRIIGYYTENESSEITKLQLSKMTHAVFAYIQMNYDGKIQFKSDMTKIRFLNLKNKSKGLKNDLKVMISIGGPDNSQYFSSVVNDSTKRKTFKKSIIAFLEEHDIDGIDLFWKWPEEFEKEEYIQFLKELREDMRNQNKQYILSIAAPQAGMNKWEDAFDMNRILEHVDFVNVFTMDYYGPWPNIWGNPAGPTSPLYSGVDVKRNFNVDYTMEYYICETRQPNKFNIVIPFFVRFWRNVEDPMDPENEVFRHVSLKNGKAEGEPYMSRWSANHEGLKLINESWDDKSKSSFVYNARTKKFVVFETRRSIEAKMKYVNEKGLGGVWIWSVDMDDQTNSLLNTVSSKQHCSSNTRNIVNFNCRT